MLVNERKQCYNDAELRKICYDARTSLTPEMSSPTFLKSLKYDHEAAQTFHDNILA